jgi:hypothetical protein
MMPLTGKGADQLEREGTPDKSVEEQYDTR